MFKNISQKLKILAYVNIIVVFTLFLVFALAAVSLKNDTVLALIFLSLAFMGSWVPSLIFYALGEIIEKLAEIEQNKRSE